MDHIWGRIYNIQRLSTHDGPGLRTTVFLKGCPLKCSWCHNPESWSGEFELGWNYRKCIACNSCIEACSLKAISRKDNKITINRSKCNLCKKCIEECPAQAMVGYGKDISPEKLFMEITKDKEYFLNSGGGVTISGGEPLMQQEFTKAVLRRCREQGIATAVDTSCYGDSEKLLGLMEYTDIILIDIKLLHSPLHKKFTGVDNGLILKNILCIKDYVEQGNPLKIYIRTPVVDGCTSGDENILAIGKFIKDNLENIIDKWELILFHNMCQVKYEELDREWVHKKTPLMDKAQLEHLKELTRMTGIADSKISITGLAID